MIEGSYRIVRFSRNPSDPPREVVKNDVTLAEAKAWCNDPMSHGTDWFDGYEIEG